MAATDQHKINFIRQAYEPLHEQEHTKINHMAKFQRCSQAMQTHAKWQALEKPENKRQMCGRKAWWSDCHTFDSYLSGSKAWVN